MSGAIILILVGLLALTIGAEALVGGAARLAAAFGVPSLIIGLTVVAFGTSSPELAVSLRSAWAGEADLAIGNVVGSNIFNVLLILGVSALIAPLVVPRQLIRLDVPLMIGVSAALYLMASNGRLGRLEAALLLMGLAGYTLFLIRVSRNGAPAPDPDGPLGAAGGSPRAGRPVRDGLIALGGLALLVFGARWFVVGAVQVAQALGVSQLVIGLTIVAAGTSMPEVATSVLATLRGHREIAVGNVVGSNIFNVLAVLGASGLASAGGIPISPAVLRFDLPVMLAVSVACLPIFFTGYRIARWEGGLFLAYYAAYVGYLVANASDHPLLQAYRGTLLYFIVPLTLIMLLVLGVRTYRRDPVHRGERPVSG